MHGVGADVTPYNEPFDKFVEFEFSLIEAFPALQIITLDLFAEGELGAVRWTFTGTHEQWGGPKRLARVEPTNEAVEVPGIDVIRVRNGEIVDSNAEWDSGRPWDQLGLVSREWLAPL